MKLKSFLLAGGLCLGGLIALAAPASAYVVCNRTGDCWHTDRREHVPGVTFRYHPDDWYFHRDWDRDRDDHWHGYHTGRGYWRGGVWITL
ncbi:MAG TPA: hypothetical protein VN718_08525 [Rhizomicrobium sp.]|nr:hypothetical protein [Rhizomicrobium sp.]